MKGGFRPEFICKTAEPLVQRVANVEHAKTRFLYVAGQAPHDRPLAICGGGPSLDPEMLREFSGDIWAVNGVYDYLLDNGIPATLVSIEANRDLAPLVTRCKKALLGDCCDPDTFDALPANADVKLFEVDTVNGGTTTATRAAMLALKLGYQHIMFFGCEGSFAAETHAYKREKYDDLVVVDADGKQFLTCPEFLIQSENLAFYITEHPGIYSEQSGGLLRAMVADSDWHVSLISEGLAGKIVKDMGILDAPVYLDCVQIGA